MTPSARYPERFADFRLTCYAELDGEPITRTHPDENGEPVEWDEPPRCMAELTFDRHYVGMRHLPGFEGRVHVLRCPECGARHGVCPVCTGEDGGPGWYRGESTGVLLACHVCNPEEYAAQERDPFRGTW